MMPCQKCLCGGSDWCAPENARILIPTRGRAPASRPSDADAGCSAARPVSTCRLLGAKNLVCVRFARSHTPTEAWRKAPKHAQLRTPFWAWENPNHAQTRNITIVTNAPAFV